MTATSPQRLESGILTIPNAIAMSAAAMAPVLAVVLNAPAAVPAAGAALPLSFLLAFVAAALVGNTVVQFSRVLPSAGSFYTFNSRGLGPAAGFFTGWLLWIGYAMLAPGLFSAFGAFLHDYLLATMHVGIPWWWLSLAAMAGVSWLSLRSIRASANLDLTLLVIEVVIFLVLGALAIATAGSGNTTRVFLVTSSPGGFTGVGLGVVFGFLSFIGFDAAATLGEETRNPKRSIPIAVIGALGSVGLFYVLAMYALTAGYRLTEPLQMAAFLKDQNPFVTLCQHVSPWLLQPVEIAAIAGIFSCFLAVHNTTVRVMFSMGRDRVLPASLAAVHTSWFSPHHAILAQTCFTVTVGLAVGFWLGPGATGSYGFTGAIGTVAIVIVYMLSNMAHIRYFWRAPGRSPFLHVVIPALSVICLAYPLASVIAPGQLFPYSLVPLVIVAWLIVGAVLYCYYRARSPEKIAAIGSFVPNGDVRQDGPRASRPDLVAAGESYPPAIEATAKHL
jgi:amino acid transporter